MIIGRSKIGCNSSAFIIAEIGVNHDGSTQRAIELVDRAADAGANAIKLQVFGAERLMHASAGFAEYQKAKVDAPNPVAMLKQYELAPADLHRIARHARDRSLAIVATPFSLDDVPVIARFADAIKIASPDLVNRVLLAAAVNANLPLIVSTGGSTAQEIDDAVTWLRSRRADFALLHCVSNYPVAPADTCLSWISHLASAGVPVGYSDHSTEVLAGALAVGYGASIIEKHITYDTSAAGPDHSASFDPPQFAEYVRWIRLAEQMRGSGPRRVLDCERDVRTISRQSLVLRQTVQTGQTLKPEHLKTQRPGTGISAVHAECVVGRVVNRVLHPGELLPADAIEGWPDAA